MKTMSTSKTIRDTALHVLHSPCDNSNTNFYYYGRKSEKTSEEVKRWREFELRAVGAFCHRQFVMSLLDYESFEFHCDIYATSVAPDGDDNQDGPYFKQGDLSQQKKFVEWLLGPDTLWPFVHESPPQVIRNDNNHIVGLLFENTDAINKIHPIHLFNFSVAARQFRDSNYHRLNTWYHLVELGVHPRVAYMASVFVCVTLLNNGKYSITKTGPTVDAHFPMNTDLSPKRVFYAQPSQTPRRRHYHNKSVSIWENQPEPNELRKLLKIDNLSSKTTRTRFTSFQQYDIGKYVEQLQQLTEKLQTDE